MPHPVKERTEKKHIGFGKVILFGEHFVVHGSKAIVAGIEEYTECRLELLRGSPGLSVVDRRPAVPGYIKEKAEEQRRAHALVLRHLKIDTSKDGLRIHLGGPLVPSSGIGASASDVVSLTRALNELYALNLTEEEVNHSAYAGECGYHGTPSGVDNTAATFGGLISYRRSGGKALFAPIACSAPLYLVVCSTGITASTVKVVEEVAKLKKLQPEWFDDLMKRYNKCVCDAKTAIRVGDYTWLGQLFNENHELCQKLTVSSYELDSIVSFCCANGALGAKMSGTGRGGLAIALTADEKKRDRLAENLLKNCPVAKFVWKYTVLPKSAKL